MLALDTNILVRFLTQDDSAQTPAVNSLIAAGGPFFLPDLVLAETFWVLRRGYQWRPPEIHAAFEALLQTTNVHYEDEAAVRSATASARVSGHDWADALILAKARAHGCAALLSFDSALRLQDPAFVRPPTPHSTP